MNSIYHDIQIPQRPHDVVSSVETYILIAEKIEEICEYVARGSSLSYLQPSCISPSNVLWLNNYWRTILRNTAGGTSRLDVTEGRCGSSSHHVGAQGTSTV
ncbi:hypothetical protein KIN20_018539 [Parelaphostrongylus tenuis]|uniref:Uncharacterized protein n=1 Tax=Parelaphostrongylus tenuis TaxID=148309 RepID=A0AAD5MJP0_PARTN|nr:hypothetical protein KIN20_018539 [Parelaphostrongylus tenuis]